MRKFCVRTLGMALGLAALSATGTAQAATIVNSWTQGNFATVPPSNSLTAFSIVSGSTVPGLGDSNNVLAANATSNQNLFIPTFNFGSYFQTLGYPNATVSFVYSELLASTDPTKPADTQFLAYSPTENKIAASYSDGTHGTTLYLAWSNFENLQTQSTSMVTVSSTPMSLLNANTGNGSLANLPVPVSYTNSYGKTAWLQGLKFSYFSQKMGGTSPAYATGAYLDNFTVTATTTYTIPEPASLALLALGGLFLLPKRKGSQRTL